MALFGAIIYALVGLYSLLVIVRIIIEMVQAFSKQFDPPHWFIMVAEPIFRMTDPPVNALRKLIPPLKLGGSGVGLDVSVIVLFFILMLIQMLIGAVLINPALQ
ncbi:YggT family protein [Corynebacterium afermentans]|uniref:YggT family protein n=1 Tax=Corynebacterium TaxID=1716 RepID=UPI00188B85C6|nr:YggT family protein [Corynebacterium afermentans]MBF4546874.1 YggT family protein [Corynebacterium afermentans subsp. lipophilum]MCG7290280.1 YggT family protein [Corynebacterium sp. ACRPZ]MCG7294388.1 YggT family protein [Corynebacterium sp. ACRPY]WJY59234.1 YGGT family protein [Corynebacterium afermentans subsp. lipophilum]